MGEPDRGQFAGVREVDASHGTAMLVPAEVVSELGMLDERLYLYVEDVDWSLRMRAAGRRTYVAVQARLDQPRPGLRTPPRQPPPHPPVLHQPPHPIRQLHRIPRIRLQPLTTILQQLPKPNRKRHRRRTRRQIRLQLRRQPQPIELT